MANLSRRLRREVTKSPKKAAFLGLAVVVAVYFWVPLVQGWIGEDEPVSVSGAISSGIEAGASGLAVTAILDEGSPAQQQTPTYGWSQLNEWISGDPTTRTADLSPFRDPFQPVRVAVSAEELAGSEASVRLAVDPARLGVKLTGTLLGARRRVALIDGRAVLEGGFVELGPKGQAIEFELIHVNRTGIVLGLNDRQFDVAISEPERTGRLKLTSNTN